MRAFDKTIYRKIAVRMWSDAKFQALSRQLPSGQSLWLYLLTGHHTTTIPGMFSAGKLSLAEALGWAPEDFDRCFAEIEAQEMAFADWSSRLVWVPNAVFYNRPDNPNVVTSWGRMFHMLPECDLRNRAHAHLFDVIGKLGQNFRTAFIDSFGPPNNTKQKTFFLGKSGTYSDAPKKAKATKKQTSSTKSKTYANPLANGSVNGSVNPSRNGLPNPPENGPGNPLFNPPQKTGVSDPDLEAFWEGGDVVSDGAAIPDISTTYVNPSANPLGNGLPNGMANQKQKQKQEQEQKHEPSNEGLSKLPPQSVVVSTPDATSDADLADGAGKALICPHREIIAGYHAILPTLPRVLENRWAGSQSATQLQARWREGLDAGIKGGVDLDRFAFTTREQGLDAFRQFFRRVAASDFLLGKTHGARQWQADLHWLVRPTNFTKVLEGRYDGRGATSLPAASKPSRLGVQPGDTFDPMGRFAEKKKVEDHRALLFDGGLYLVGSDCLLLQGRDGSLFDEELAAVEPFGQVVRVRQADLPRRVQAWLAIRNKGWLVSPKEPMDASELPTFPPSRVAQAA